MSGRRREHSSLPEAGDRRESGSGGHCAVDLLLQLKGQHETRQVLIPSTPKPSNTVCITKREGNHLLKLLLQKTTLTMQLKLAIDFPVEGLSHHLVNCHPLK